jgi:hypothetical protein
MPLPRLWGREITLQYVAAEVRGVMPRCVGRLTVRLARVVAVLRGTIR